MNQPSSIVARQVRQCRRGINARAFRPEIRDRCRHAGRDNRTNERTSTVPLFDGEPLFERCERFVRNNTDGEGDVAALETRPEPMPRCIEHDRTADAEVRPQHRATETDRRRTVRSNRDRGRVRNARQPCVPRIVENKRHERRRGLDVLVPERTRKRVTSAIAPRLGQRSTACGEHEERGPVCASIRGCKDEVFFIVVSPNT